MTKQELRKIYLEKRQSLSEAEYGQRNFQLYQNFFSMMERANQWVNDKINDLK
jgi:5-formyltetrahydrofolate cyclo-ligase